jgi:hypothetical protein
MLAFIGDDSSVPFTGGYFKNIKIGPTISDIRIEASGSGVSITGATFVLSLNGIITKIDHSSPEGYPAGVQVYDAANNRINLGISVSMPKIYLKSSTYGGSVSILAGVGGYVIVTDALGTSGIELNGQYYDSGSWRGHITSGSGNFVRSLAVNFVTVVDSSAQFVGYGVSCPSYGIGGAGHNTYQGGAWYYGVVGPTTFTTADGKTVTVRGGVITSIV